MFVCRSTLLYFTLLHTLYGIGSYKNPILPSGPADPDVIEFDGTFYLFSTGDSISYRYYESDNLTEWVEGSHVFKGTKNVWAPDLHLSTSEQKVYLYYTENFQIGVAVADSPRSEFLSLGIILKNAIDAHLFEDEDGACYLYYVKDSERAIYARKMLNYTQISTEEALICMVTEPYETKRTEGPFIMKKDEVYYLLYSSGSAGKADYRVCYATSDSPMGPFVKDPNHNPVLERDDARGIWGSGHGAVIEDHAGNLWHFYQQKNTPDQGWDRSICIDPIWIDEFGILRAKMSRGEKQSFIPVTKAP